MKRIKKETEQIQQQEKVVQSQKINSSNTSMLIFYDSDEESSKTNTNIKYKRQRQRYKGRQINTSKMQAAQLKPSFMNSVDDDDCYESVLTPQRKDHKKQERQHLLQMGQIQKMTLKLDQGNKIIQGLLDKSCQQVQKQSFQPINANKFQQLQARLQQQTIQNQQNLLIDFNEPIPQQQQQPSNQTNNLTMDILTLDQKVRQKSLYFQTILKDQSKHNNIIKLMLSPILKQTKLIFEVYVSSGFIGKSFEFAMETGTSLQLLMKAQRSMGINKTSYKIQVYFQNSKEFSHLCTLQSDMDRRQYNILKPNINNGRTQVLGTIINKVTVKTERHLTLYYPKINKANNRPELIFDNNLERQYQNKGKNVDFIITTKFTEEQEERCMQDYGFRKSAKSMEFKDSKGELKLIIGKKQSKRYSLICGPGLTPIQIFCTTIVNIQI